MNAPTPRQMFLDWQDAGFQAFESRMRRLVREEAEKIKADPRRLAEAVVDAILDDAHAWGLALKEACEHCPSLQYLMTMAVYDMAREVVE